MSNPEETKEDPAGSETYVEATNEDGKVDDTAVEDVNGTWEEDGTEGGDEEKESEEGGEAKNEGEEERESIRKDGEEEGTEGEEKSGEEVRGKRLQKRRRSHSELTYLLPSLLRSHAFCFARPLLQSPPATQSASKEEEKNQEEENELEKDGPSDAPVEDHFVEDAVVDAFEAMEVLAEPKKPKDPPQNEGYKPWMTPQMKPERPIPSSSQVSAVTKVAEGWRANPPPEAEIRFFEYGNNKPRGVNPTKEMVGELVRAVME